MIVLFSILLFSKSYCVSIVLYLLAHTDSFHEKGAIRTRHNVMMYVPYSISCSCFKSREEAY
jgi:hypothetical protein